MIRHSASVRSVWYIAAQRVCCARVIGVHIVSSRKLRNSPESRLSRSLNPFQNSLLPILRSRDELAEAFAPDQHCVVGIEIGAFRHRDDETVKGFDIADLQ